MFIKSDDLTLLENFKSVEKILYMWYGERENEHIQEINSVCIYWLQSTYSLWRERINRKGKGKELEWTKNKSKDNHLHPAFNAKHPSVK
jgi:hypothetical protein